MSDAFHGSRYSPQISRRGVLLGAAAVGGLAGLPDFGRAQAMPHSFKQGDLEVTVVSDGNFQETRFLTTHR